jgi:hypothetical protein
MMKLDEAVICNLPGRTQTRKQRNQQPTKKSFQEIKNNLLLHVSANLTNDLLID